MNHFRSIIPITALLVLLLISACTLPTQVPAATADAPASQATQSESGSAEHAGNSTLAGTTTFTLVPEESEARFVLSEVLLGVTRPVIGATRQLNGEIIVDPSNPSASTVGVIEIDAGSLATDNQRRDTAVRRFILQTEQYPQITFTPMAISGMPGTVDVGDTVNFQLTGNLQIREIANPVIFDVTVDVVSATELTGSARTIVLRSDYDLTIPNVPSVTDVSEEVELVFDFTARTS